MCTYGIGLPFDHPIWQNLPPCHCGIGAQPLSSAVRFEDFGIRIAPEPDIWPVAPLPPAKARRMRRGYEAPTR
jgi:hypothetical protein